MSDKRSVTARAIELMVSIKPKPIGRPKAPEPRPWHIAGISRATWYRRKKKEAGK